LIFCGFILSCRLEKEDCSSSKSYSKINNGNII